MATYKVLQDIEAEDKLVGPLTLRQCIYAAIMFTSLYLGFLSATKHAAVMLVVFVPVAGLTGFFAFPWKQDQPTEVWALAKIRFYLKPRRRIWDQSDVKQLVTITVPKHVERHLTNGLNQEEVHSRLSALAATIDSRGWAIKNLNVNLNTAAVLPAMETSDRLVQASSLPQEVSNIDVRASDDMLDANANPVAQHFESMITASAAAHRQQLIAQMQQPSAPMTASVQQAAAPTSVSATKQSTKRFLVYAPHGDRARAGNLHRHTSGSTGRTRAGHPECTASRHTYRRRRGTGEQVQTGKLQPDGSVRPHENPEDSRATGR
jgi:hypothetical protein